MLNISHHIKIGGKTHSSTQNSRLIALRTSSDLDIPVNSCRISLSHPEDLSVALEDEVVMELGYGDDLKTVFTGTVTQIDWQIAQVHIEASSQFIQLVQSHFNLFFEKSKAGDIVSSISQETDVKTGKVENGLEFDFYTIGNNISAYQHIKQLALQCGFDIYADEKDKLIFAPASGGDSHPFQFGINILSLSIEKIKKPFKSVQVFGESPASHGEGKDAASWLTKKEVTGTASGTGNIQRDLIDPTARSQETATKIAEAYFKNQYPEQVGVLIALGNATIKLGDEIEVSKMPTAEQNGTYKVSAIHHIISVRKGFISKIKLVQI